MLLGQTTNSIIRLSLTFLLIATLGSTEAQWTEPKYGEGKIPVVIRLRPAPEQLHGKIYVTTGTKYTLTAEVTDEHYKNVTLTYQWSIKNKTIVTDPKASHIEYTFSEPENSDFIKVLVVHTQEDTGVSEEDLVVYDPMVIVEFKGDSVLTQGDLLNVSILFTGTLPARYSYKICAGSAPRSDCSGYHDQGETARGSINLVHYLRYVGDYTLMVQVSNTASKTDKSYHIKIVDTVRIQSLPITPIVCSIAAVLVLATGFMLHFKFKRTIFTEAADFDYDDDDDWPDQWDMEQSFMQRVRYLMFSDGRADQAGQSLSSILSGSRTRLV